MFLNGRFLALEDATVSVMDRGFLFGDGVYEVIPVYGDRLFRFDEHLDRLNASLQQIHLQNPMSTEEWRQILQQLINGTDACDQAIYLQVTRGLMETRDHAFPDPVKPTVFAMVTPKKKQDPRVLERGVKAITLDDIRWQYCSIKAITLLANVLARQEAREHDATEALLIRNGYVLEGAASNIFMVKNNTLFTPPKGSNLLPGITRDLILELAAKHNILAEEIPIPLADLQQADEIWLSSSTSEILAVTELDGRAVGNAVPGLVWRQMTAIFQQYKLAFKEQALS